MTVQQSGTITQVVRKEGMVVNIPVPCLQTDRKIDKLASLLKCFSFVIPFGAPRTVLTLQPTVH